MNTLNCVVCDGVILKGWFVDKFRCEGQAELILRGEKEYQRREGFFCGGYCEGVC